MIRNLRFLISSTFFTSLFAVESISQSIELDKNIGTESARAVAVQMGIYDDTVLTAYLSNMGNRLVDALPEQIFEYQFQIVDSPTPNAFALPGGYVYVTRGLLALVNNENELACTIGHEIVHVHNRHSIQQMKKGILPGILEIPGKIVGAVVGEDLGTLVNLPITTGKKLVLSSYSRRHETEADRLGVTLAARAGYDPKAMVDILDRIITWEEAVTHEKEQKSYFSDHPYTPKRVERLNELTARLNWTGPSAEADLFPDILNRLVFGENPDQGVFVEELFLHPNLNFKVSFPSGWKTFNEPTAVGAMRPDERRFIALTPDDTTSSPKESGTAFIKALKKQGYQLRIKGQKLTVRGSEAYLVSIQEVVDNSSMYIYLMWLRFGDQLFKIIALSPVAFIKETVAVALSIKTLTEADRALVTIKILSVVEANESLPDPWRGEGLADFCSRANNELSAELTAIMNGLDQKAHLKSGQKIKVVLKKPFYK